MNEWSRELKGKHGAMEVSGGNYSSQLQQVSQPNELRAKMNGFGEPGTSRFTRWLFYPTLDPGLKPAIVFQTPSLRWSSVSIGESRGLLGI